MKDEEKQRNSCRIKSTLITLYYTVSKQPSIIHYSSPNNNNNNSNVHRKRQETIQGHDRRRSVESRCYERHDSWPLGPGRYRLVGGGSQGRVRSPNHLCHVLGRQAWLRRMPQLLRGRSSSHVFQSTDL